MKLIKKFFFSGKTNSKILKINKRANLIKKKIIIKELISGLGLTPKRGFTLNLASGW